MCAAPVERQRPTDSPAACLQTIKTVLERFGKEAFLLSIAPHLTTVWKLVAGLLEQPLEGLEPWEQHCVAEMPCV